MKITPGYAPLPARFASIEDHLRTQSALVAMGAQEFSKDPLYRVATP